MERQNQRRLKATLTIIDTDIKACRIMVNNPAMWNAEDFRKHTNDIIQYGGKLLSLLDPQRIIGEEVHS